MIAKIIKGAVFKNLVNYILDEKKGTKLLGFDGIRTQDNDLISLSFQYQAQLNHKVEKPVGHIALGFSAQDKEVLSDELMVKIAQEYMEKMGITNTQYFIGRHFDKEHPHLHIAFNRVNNDGKTITDKNERYRSEKICKEITRKYDLYYASGKENVKYNRLKEPDKTKYEIYDTIKTAIPNSNSWQSLIDNLQKSEIQVQFKYKGKTDEIQGVTFIKNGLSFSGSKVDKTFSFSKLDKALNKEISQQKIEDKTIKENQATIIKTGQKDLEEVFDYSSTKPLNENSPEDEDSPNNKKKRKRNFGLNR